MVEDPRATIRTVDVAVALAERQHEPWDAIVLDVDNGPDFLIHDTNATLYSEAGLALAYGRLVRGGLLAVWCQGPTPSLWAALETLSTEVAVHTHLVQRGDRRWSSVIYTARRGGAPRSSPE